MKIIKLSMLAAVLLTTGAISVKAQTADEIMDKHAAAIGGVDNWNKIKTVKMVGSMSQQGMEISMTQTIDLAKGARLDISVMGMTGYQIVTNTGGWAYMPFAGSTKIDTLSPEVVKATQNQFDLKGHQMLDYKTKGTKIELAGKDTINNVLCYKMKCTEKDGKESTAYFDATTYYLLRTERMEKMQDQEQEVAIVYNNYQKLPEGVVMPMSVNIAGGEITYKTVELNKPVDASTFVPTPPAK
jgi:outer membrane lipoprotein-sorting protein